MRTKTTRTDDEDKHDEDKDDEDTPHDNDTTSTNDGKEGEKEDNETNSQNNEARNENNVQGHIYFIQFHVKGGSSNYTDNFPDAADATNKLSSNVFRDIVASLVLQWARKGTG